MAGNGGTIPPIKMLIFLGKKMQMALFYQHKNRYDEISHSNINHY